MARRRKPGARTPSGRLSRSYKGPARDTGTPELQAKRLALVGPDADPALASSALGCLLARGCIDRDQHAQGLEYGRLRCALFGPPWPSNTFGLEATDTRLRGISRRFRAMAKLLTKPQEHVLSDVCAFNRWPQWFFNELIGLKHLPADHAEKALLVGGLDALVSGGHMLPRLTDEQEICYAHY